MWMDVDAALSEVPVNIMSLVDDTDYKTREVAIVYNSAGMDLVWNFTTTAGLSTQTAVTPTTAGDYDWSHQGDGIYTIEIPASAGASINNDTEGFGWFSGIVTGVLPWRGPVIGFRAAALNNALIDGGDNLDVNTVQWLGTAVTISSTTSKPEVDAYSISDDATAADNLELQYDTTGLSGDTFPATQAAVANIGAASGGSVNIEASEDNTAGAIIDSVTFVGSVTSGTYANTESEDGTPHSMNDTGNIIAIVYGFDVGGSRAATSVSIVANLNGNTDEVLIKAYDHVGAGWDTIGTLLGSGGSSYVSLDLALLTKHTGTGSELGKTYVGFDTDSTSPNSLDVDMILISAVSTSTSVGYANGAYWVDSAGTAGTEIGTNGTADNPCTWANAITMNATQPLNRFQIANGNTVTLSANCDNCTLMGSNWNLALGGQSIEGTAVLGTATITGIGTATVTPPTFSDCNFGAATIPPSELRQCGIGNASGTLTGGSAGQYIFDNCFSEVPGSGSPSLVFTGLGSTTGINNRRWAGGATYTLDSNCTLSHEVLAGGATTITTGGADVEVRGMPRALTVTMSAAETLQFVGVTGPIVLNGTTTATVNLYGVSASVTDSTSAATVTDKTVNQANINTEADTALTDYDPPTNTEMEARTLAAASYFDPAADTVSNVTEVAQMAGTIGTLDALDTAQDTQHASTQSDIAALNDLSAAAVNAEVDTALSDYDGPTNAEMEARTLVSASYFDPAADAVANVTLVGTTTTNTDMRGTDSANTVVPMTAALSQTEHDATQSALSTVDANVDSILTDTGTTLPASIATVDANVDAILADTGTDGVIVVTNNDKTGYALSSSGIDAILDEPITEPSGVFAWPATLRNIVGWIGALNRNKITQTSTAQTLRNDADSADIAASTVSDDGTTGTRGEYT